MEYTLWSPFEPDLDRYSWVTDSWNGLRVTWPIEKSLTPALLEEFAQEKAHLPSPLKDKLSPLDSQSPGFCYHEAAQLVFLAVRWNQKGGPAGQFDQNVSPPKGLMADNGECFLGGHKVYGGLKPCEHCRELFCPNHIMFLIDGWWCKSCRRDLQLKVLGG